MAGVKDIGSLDSDRGFVSSLASGVTSVASAANSLADMFKDRVQAIYPGKWFIFVKNYLVIEIGYNTILLDQ